MYVTPSVTAPTPMMRAATTPNGAMQPQRDLAAVPIQLKTGEPDDDHQRTDPAGRDRQVVDRDAADDRVVHTNRPAFADELERDTLQPKEKRQGNNE